jgi:hypothetical protein
LVTLAAITNRFGYHRSHVVFADGNYVDMAKRCRRHVMETGCLSLKKDRATPVVAELFGIPHHESVFS